MGPKRRRPSQATDDRSETSDTSPNTTPQMKRRKKSVQYDPVGYFCTGKQTYISCCTTIYARGELLIIYLGKLENLVCI